MQNLVRMVGEENNGQMQSRIHVQLSVIQILTRIGTQANGSVESFRDNHARYEFESLLASLTGRERAERILFEKCSPWRCVVEPVSPKRCKYIEFSDFPRLSSWVIDAKRPATPF